MLLLNVFSFRGSLVPFFPVLSTMLETFKPEMRYNVVSSILRHWKHMWVAATLLVKECLHNSPDQRPTTDDLLARLQRMREEVEGEYGGSVKLDMVRVRLAKEVKIKDRRIEELTQQLGTQT